MLARIGGFDSIRDALIDDCALAKIVKQTGARIWLGVSEMPIRSVRGYGAAREVRRMIARSAFAQLDHSALLLAATVAGILIAYITPVYLLIRRDPVAATSGAAAWLLSAALFLPTVRFYDAPLWTAAALPAIAAFYLLATVESAVDYWSGRGGEWKGRIQDARGDRLVL
jgi:hypothetical protein